MSDTGNSSWLDPQTREQLYHFLAAAYLRPLRPEALRQITDPGVQQELAALFGEEALMALRRYSSSARAEDLQQEFMNLFAVPARRKVPSPGLGVS